MNVCACFLFTNYVVFCYETDRIRNFYSLNPVFCRMRSFVCLQLCLYSMGKLVNRWGLFVRSTWAKVQLFATKF